MRTFLLILLALLGVITPVHAEESLILGVQDYGKSPRMLGLEFRKLGDYLSKRLGQKVSVEPVRSYERYMEGASKKRYAIMYGPPSMVLEANQLAGYEPVARVPGKLSATFMSMADGPVAFPEDMKGRRLGLPDDKSLMAKLANAKLREMRINPKQYFASISHFEDAEDVISALKLGLIDVGVANSTLYNVWGARGFNLNNIMQTAGSLHLTFAVRPDMPADIKARLVAALLDAHKDPLGRDYLKQSGFPNFERAALADYNDLKKLIQIR